MDISLLSDLTKIHYEESNLAFLISNPLYFNCSIQILCVQGDGIISTGAQCFHIRKMNELIFWRGSIMQLIHSSDDFYVRMVLYPKRIFLQAAISLDTTYFNYMTELPLYDHGQEKDAGSWEQVNIWMDMARILFTKEIPVFRERMELNFLQNMLMWIFSSIPEIYVSTKSNYTRKQLLFHRFMYLIHEYALQEHQVGFYSEKLCISSRYLNEITVEHSNGKTPKELIDEQLIAEIKVQLNNMNLSFTEIAGICRFPDSSYLSRFFKKNTGLTPSEFRNRRKQ